MWPYLCFYPYIPYGYYRKLVKLECACYSTGVGKMSSPTTVIQFLKETFEENIEDFLRRFELAYSETMAVNIRVDEAVKTLNAVLGVDIRLGSDLGIARSQKGQKCCIDGYLIDDIMANAELAVEYIGKGRSWSVEYNCFRFVPEEIEEAAKEFDAAMRMKGFGKISHE